MRRHLQLAGMILLTVAWAHAQIHSPQVTIKKKQRPQNIEWLWQYSPSDKNPEGDENRLVLDPRFEPLLKLNFTAPQAFFGRQMGNAAAAPTSLAETAAAFLAVPDKVRADGNRYLTITGCLAHFCPDRGLLWADLNASRNQEPLLIFAAIDWTTENRTPDEAAATYTLWIFPNQPLSLEVTDPNRIPQPFLASLRRWTAEPSSGTNHVPHITTAVLVDPDGTPHQLPPESLGINQKAKP